jgi:hypothetical protein
MNPNKALIVGNGLSRKDIDLREVARVNDNMTIFGCNAIYRDYAPDYNVPDYLVAIDEGIITEIECSTFPSSRVIIPPEEECWEPREIWAEIPAFSSTPRSNAGTNAILEAIKRGYTDLRLVGFDSFVYEKNIAESNIYEGTENYSTETKATFEESISRVRYISWIVEKNRNVTFTFYLPENVPYISIDLPNVHYKTYAVL